MGIILLQRLQNVFTAYNVFIHLYCICIWVKRYYRLSCVMATLQLCQAVDLDVDQPHRPNFGATGAVYVQYILRWAQRYCQRLLRAKDARLLEPGVHHAVQSFIKCRLSKLQ